MKKAVIAGAGMAGCEAALQLANAGYDVTVYDNKNLGESRLYRTSNYGELICMNSLGGIEASMASGLCRIELEHLGSRMLEIARECRIEDPKFFRVNKARFSELATEKLACSGVKIVQKEIIDIPEGDVVLFATGPNTNMELLRNLSGRFDRQPYFTSSACCPALYENSIDFQHESVRRIDERRYAVEIPVSVFEEIIRALATTEPTHMHEIDLDIDLSTHVPVEKTAKENIPALKEKFLNPKTGSYELILEKDCVLYGVYNVVGFYTRIGVLLQRTLLRMIPALEQAVFARYGLMHKDTYFYSPGFLNQYFRIKKSAQPIYIIGQLSGCDGYLRAFASAIIAANNILYGDIPLSEETMAGGLARFISNEKMEDYQPISATYGLIKHYTDPEAQEKKSVAMIQEYNSSCVLRKGTV